MTQQLTFSERLRATTDELGQQLKLTPFVADFGDQALPPESYRAFLETMTIVYGGLEAAAAQARHPLVAAIAGPALAKRALLERDVERLGESKTCLTDELRLRGHLLGWIMEGQAQHQPIALLGSLYALGQWASGIAGTSQPDGAAFLASFEPNAGAAALRQLSDAALSDAERDQIVAAAQDVSAQLTQILMAAHPLFARPLASLANVLNPTAGNHAIPDDLREIRAAIRAGERTWRELPYYAWRYATRGIRYTYSDSAWLTSLCAYQPDYVLQQIAWLGRVLASRGMPQWMLERHLGQLHAELVAAVPERVAAFAVLAQAAERLRDQRLASLPEGQFERLVAAFEAAVGPEWQVRLPFMGYIIVAAVADERAGIAHAVDSLAGWVTDRSRFPEVWVAAAQATIERARSTQ